jgi:ubiquinone/menaquinone biosynthesis C-methylase UbiE
MRFANPRANVQKFRLQEGMRVADFGAGVGAYTLPAAQYVGVTGKVYAIDIQQELLRKIITAGGTEGCTNIEVIWGDVESYGGSALADQSVHRVIISNLLFLSSRKADIVKEAYRILKTNGKVLLIEWKDSFGGAGPKKESLVSMKDAKKLFTDEGFVVDEEIDPGFHHYGIIFKKI